MKKLFIYTLIIGGLVACHSTADIDRSKAPKAGPAPTINIGKAESFTLENGLKVFVVENNKLPRVAYRLFVDKNPVLEKEKAGMLSIYGDLMRAGTDNRDKNDIDEEVDYIGATMSVSSSGIYGASLTKNQDKLLEVMSDVLLNPTFPEEELDKLVTQSLSALKSSENDPGAISSTVGNVLRFGKTHPYGEVATEETYENLRNRDFKKFYKKYFKPNISYLVVVGDIDLESAKAKAEKYFGSWERGEVTMEEPDPVMGPGKNKVVLVERSGAVQSMISITYPIDAHPKSEDAIKIRVMNEILGGGGFSSRLMKNIREDKAYTYGAYSSTNTDRFVGYFNASASVRNEVTDSAIVEFLKEMNYMRNNLVDDSTLTLIKNKLSGAFARSLESPQTVANFSLNTVRYKLPADYYENYLVKLNAITAEDIQAMSKKYLKPDEAYILIVGSAEVADKVAKFDANNEVLFLDPYGNKAERVKPAPEGVTVQTIMDAYFKEIGADKKAKLTSLYQEMEMKPAGAPVTLGMKNYQSNGKFKTLIEMGGSVVQTTVFNGKEGKASGMMGSKEYGEEDMEDLKEQAEIFSEGDWDKGDDSYELLGTINGTYKVKITDKDGNESFKYYDTETNLLVKSESSSEDPRNPEERISVVTEYDEYMEVDGMKFPSVINTSEGGQGIAIKLLKVEPNKKISDDEFKVN